MIRRKPRASLTSFKKYKKIRHARPENETLENFKVSTMAILSRSTFSHKTSNSDLIEKIIFYLIS